MDNIYYTGELGYVIFVCLFYIINQTYDALNFIFNISLTVKEPLSFCMLGYFFF
ncbi:hypothetical protein C1646_697132 [Rhizophagus diaphanus]|nr:hypothetical protein C1646_697132 [Rhizophagus diaphanus] [Rhizophagus sp. MUCL 43196]